MHQNIQHLPSPCTLSIEFILFPSPRSDAHQIKADDFELFICLCIVVWFMMDSWIGNPCVYHDGGNTKQLHLAVWDGIVAWKLFVVFEVDNNPDSPLLFTPLHLYIVE